MIPMQFNSDIINKPKYNILKKKLFNYSLKKNRLGIKLNNDSKNIFSLISIKENKHFSTKSTNKKFDFPDKNGKPYKSSGGEMTWNGILKREIPQNWDYLTTDKLTNVVTGKEDANFSISDGEYPFFTCSHENLRCALPAFSGKAILIAGNGDFNVKHYNGTFNAYQRTYVLIPDNDKYYGVMYFAALDKLASFRAKANGSIIKFITKGDIESIGVFDCHDDKIYEQINTIIEQIEVNQTEIEVFTKQRDELLPLLMNGQVNSDLSFY